jgi:phosphoglycerate dehydrogenase-like enzyme
MDTANEAALAAFADVVSEGGRTVPLSRSEVADRLAGCDAILSLNGEGAGEIPSEVVSEVGTIRLVCIAQYWGGNHFPHLERDTGVPVVEGSNAATRAVAEWNLAAALMGVRKLHLFDRALKAGSPWGEQRRQAGLLAGRLAGMVGLGRIGLYTARAFRALGIDVVAYSRSCAPEKAAALGIVLAPLEEVLRRADIVSLHHRVTATTRGMLGARELAWLKDGCVVINSARAALYDEAALLAELKKGRITAYLDVFAIEPLPFRHPLRALPNVVLTPHIAGNNAEMFRQCARDAIRTLRDCFATGVMVDRRYDYP